VPPVPSARESRPCRFQTRTRLPLRCWAVRQQTLREACWNSSRRTVLCQKLSRQCHQRQHRLPGGADYGWPRHLPRSSRLQGILSAVPLRVQGYNKNYSRLVWVLMKMARTLEERVDHSLHVFHRRITLVKDCTYYLIYHITSILFLCNVRMELAVSW